MMVCESDPHTRSDLWLLHMVITAIYTEDMIIERYHCIEYVRLTCIEPNTLKDSVATYKIYFNFIR